MAGVFPGTVKSYREMNASLMSHVRYPTDMFNIQRTMLNKYHVTNAIASTPVTMSGRFRMTRPMIVTSRFRLPVPRRCLAILVRTSR